MPVSPHPSRRSLLPLAASAVGLFVIGATGLQRGDLLASGTPRLPRQLVFAAVAAVVSYGISHIPYRRLRPLATPASLVSLVLLAGVFLFPPRGGSRRWIPLGPVDLQASEVAKVAFVLALASKLAIARNVLTLRGVLSALVMAAIPMLLVLREPDLGTALLFGPAAIAMLVATGARRRDLLLVAAVALVLLPVLWTGMSAEQKSRVTAVTSQVDGGPAPQGDGYHLHQSKQNIALGGSSGRSIDDLLATEPLAYHLPAARTDFILCLIGQRFGLVGTLAVLGLVCLLASSGLSAAASTRDPFGRLLAVGLTTLLFTQATINIAMTVGLVPITGITLPLCSYGGSSLVATGVSLGLIASVARHPGYDVADSVFATGSRI